MCQNGSGKVKGKLTSKQAAFIEEYFLDFNATRAAKRAGYSQKYNVAAATGSRLLKNAKVAERIRQRFQESAMSADEVLARLAEQARGVPSEYVGADGGVNISAIVEDGNAHLIKKIKDTHHGREYEFYDSQSALALIGKHHALFTKRTENFNVDLTQLTDEQLERLANGEDIYSVLSASGESRAGETKTKSGAD